MFGFATNKKAGSQPDPEKAELIQGHEEIEKADDKGAVLQEKIRKLGEKAKDIQAYGTELLSMLAEELGICQAAFFVREKRNKKDYMAFRSGYAYYRHETENLAFEIGEGLVGQVARDGFPVNFSSVPEGYMTILSGLGQASPKALFILPVKNGNRVTAVIELAAFQHFTEEKAELIKSIGTSVQETCSRICKKK